MGFSIQGQTGQPCSCTATYVKDTQFNPRGDNLLRITNEDNALHPANQDFGVFVGGMVNEYSVGESCAALKTGEGDSLVLLKPSSNSEYTIADTGNASDYDTLNVDLRALGAGAEKGITLNVSGYEKLVFTDPDGGPLVTLTEYDKLNQRPDVAAFLSQNGIVLNRD